MPYTSQGYMTHADVQETLKDMDMGTTVIDLQDPPAWFLTSFPTFTISCPCGVPLMEHESVTVQDASGEIFMCSEGWHEEAPAEQDFSW